MNYQDCTPKQYAMSLINMQGPLDPDEIKDLFLNALGQIEILNRRVRELELAKDAQ